MLILIEVVAEINKSVAARSQAVQEVADGTKRNAAGIDAINKIIESGIQKGRGIRKNKWWCIGFGGASVVILALVLGLYFGLRR
jgi:t-SNARE complex subunit (syntaxin)